MDEQLLREQDKMHLEVTVHGAPGLMPFAVACTVPTGMVFDEGLCGDHLHHAMDNLARLVADTVLKEARQARREQERLHALLGGPPTPERMEAHILGLLQTTRPDTEEGGRGRP